MFNHLGKHTRQKSAEEGGRNTDHSTAKNTHACHLARAGGQMHFSSATPTGGILARTARGAETIRATSASSPPAPDAHHGPAPTLVPASRSSQNHPERDPECQAGPPSRSLPATQRGLQCSPRTVRPARLAFQRQASFPHARQESCTLPTHSVSLPLSRQQGKVPPPVVP